MSGCRILVAGIGNVFLGDDGFGVEVVQRLAGRDLPPGVRVVDIGIRGFDLVHALLDGDGRDAVILVDAAPRGGPAGALYVIQPDPNELMPPSARAMDGIEPHALDPLRVLRLAWALGARPKHVRIVGCEPAPVAPDDADAGCQGLSEPVRLALDEAVGLVEATIAELARMELRERPHA